MSIRSTLISALSEAIAEEHPCEDSQGCDIARAMEEDLTLWAARLLIGATDCPITEAAYAAVVATDSKPGQTEAETEAERAELCKLPHWSCEACNAVNWTSDFTAICASCHHDECKGARERMKSAEYAMGDVNPIDHSGGWVWPDGTAEYIEPHNWEETEECEHWSVYSFDVLGSEIEDYDLDAVCKSCDVERADLLAPFAVDLATLEGEARMQNLRARCGAWEAVAGHYGWGEIDSLPLVLSRREIATRYAENPS